MPVIFVIKTLRMEHLPIFLTSLRPPVKPQPPTPNQMQQLVTLVHQLQRQYNIPADQIMHERNANDPSADLFPEAQFRKQLLTPQQP